MKLHRLSIKDLLRTTIYVMITIFVSAGLLAGLNTAVGRIWLMLA